jgi:hypothetical protein
MYVNMANYDKRELFCKIIYSEDRAGEGKPTARIKTFFVATDIETFG